MPPMGDNDYKNRYFIKIRTKDENKKLDPRFTVTVKEGKQYIDKKPQKWMLGYLFKVEKGSYEWEGKTNKTAKFYFKSGEDTYILEGTYTNILRSIINSLASADFFGPIKITIYESKKGYAAIFMQNDGQKMGWKYSWEEQMITAGEDPSVGKIHDGNMPHLNEFFERVLVEDIAAIIDRSPTPPDEAPVDPGQTSSSNQGAKTQESKPEGELESKNHYEQLEQETSVPPITDDPGPGHEEPPADKADDLPF